VEAQLVAQAHARGLSLEDYLKRVVELQASTRVALPSERTRNHAEWERDFEAFIDSFPQLPILSDQAITRDSIYTREDEL
jgi:hypothetical protein